MTDVGCVGIRLNWLDKVIKKIHEGKELQLLYQKVVGLRVRVNETKQMLHQATSKVGG